MATNNPIELVKEEKSLIRAFTMLRFPLAVFVIMIHHNCMNEMLGSCSPYNVDTILYSILKILPKCTVPCFYIISGFFYFYNVTDFNFHSYKQKLKKRITSLMIPYILWNLIAYMVLACKEFITGTTIIEGGLLHFDVFVSSFWLYNGSTTPINAPLWFLRDLIIIVILFTPPIYKAIRHFPILFLSALVLLYVFRDSYVLSNIYPFLPNLALLYFSIGAYICLNRECFLKRIHVTSYWLSIMLFIYMIGVVLCIVPNTFQEQYKLITANILGVILIMSLAYKAQALPIYDWSIKLNGTCFFLFALHILLVNSTEALLSRLFPYINSISLVFCLSVLLNVLLCITAYHLISFFSPRIAMVLTGGRK